MIFDSVVRGSDTCDQEEPYESRGSRTVL